MLFKILENKYGVCRLHNTASIPEWIGTGEFISITRTEDELSMVCLEEGIPEEIPCERGWRILKIQGPLDFTMIGVLSEISMLLAKEEISIFVISTFDTDYILLKELNLGRAKEVLIAENHIVTVK